MSLDSEEAPVPVPDVSGLFTGMLRSSMLNVELNVGSKFRLGVDAVDPANAAPGVPPPNPPPSAFKIEVSANHGLYRCTMMSRLFCSASSTASWRVKFSLPS